MKQETTPRETAIPLDRLCQQHEAILLAGQTLHEHCQELGRVLAELKNQPQDTNGHYSVELEVLRMGNECLQQLVGERDQQRAQLSEGLEGTAQGEPQGDPQAEALLAEMQALREQLKEKEAEIEKLQAAGQGESKESFTGVGDRDYEAELTQFRREL